MTYREKCIAAILACCISILAGCGGGGSGGVQPTPPTPEQGSFTISTNTTPGSPLSVIIARPGNSTTVTIVPQNGFAATATVSLSGLPAGVNATPSTWQQQPDETKTVMFTATAAAPSGAITLKLKGVSGSLSSSASIFLNIDSFFTQDVDTNGGVVAVTDPASPLFGVTLEIPPGALPSPTHIGLNPGANAGTVGILSGQAVDIRPSGLQLNLPAYLSIPYMDADDDGLVDDSKSNGVNASFLQMHGYDTTRQRWAHLSTVVDSTAHKVKGELWHFSLYRWIHRRFPDNSKVTYAIGALPANRTAEATDDQIKANIQAALSQWQKQMSLSGITFDEVALNQYPDVTFKWTNQGFIKKMVWTLLDFNTVGYTSIGLSGKIEIEFYDDAKFTNKEGLPVYYTWTTDPSVTSGMLNVRAVALHELGHTLGIEHICRCQQLKPDANCPKAVMNSDASDTPAIELFGSDIRAYHDLYGLIFAESGPTDNTYASGLYVVNPIKTGTDTLLGYIKDTVSGTYPIITDVAVPPMHPCTPSLPCEVLYGVSYDTLYIINLEGGATPVGPLGVSDLNSITFDKNGTLYGVTVSGNLLRINTQTGLATIIGPTGYHSSGDLLFYGYFGNLPLYGTMSFGLNDILVKIDPFTGVATRVNSTSDIGFGLVWGLAGTSTFYQIPPVETKWMVGLTTSNQLIEINTKTGQGKYVRTLSFPAYGASSAVRSRQLQ